MTRSHFVTIQYTSVTDDRRHNDNSRTLHCNGQLKCYFYIGLYDLGTVLMFFVLGALYMCLCWCWWCCIMYIDSGLEVVRFIVQLSQADFQPNDIQVVAYDSKLRVVARQEVTSSTGVTSRREFTRELDVTRPIMRSTLRAVLQSSWLWIAAVMMTSSATSDDVIMSSAVSSVLPPDGRHCQVLLRWTAYSTRGIAPFSHPVASLLKIQL